MLLGVSSVSRTPHRAPRHGLQVLLVALGSLLVVSGVVAAEVPDSRRLDELVESQVEESWVLFRDLLALPNDAHYPEQHLEANVQYMRQAFEARGFEVAELQTAGFPLLLAQRRVAAPSRTVLIYLQLDGQPADPDHWEQEDPWVPVLKQPVDGGWEPIGWDRLSGPKVDPEWRIFARSASDAKGPAAMFLTALDAFDEAGYELSYDLKVIMDFEEELGSPNLPAAVGRHREALEADSLLIFDGPRHYSNRPSLTFGARGIATIELLVFGPRVPQHSGHFGNYAPNPALRLAQLLASMKDDKGRVVIDGFYDGVEIDAASREILDAVPDDEEEIRRRLGIAEADAVAPTYQQAMQYPSLNVRGMSSGWVGAQVRTIVPGFAVAEIDVRLTPEVDPERLMQLIRDHVVAQGYHLVEDEPSDDERSLHSRLARFRYEVSYEAFRTPFDSDVGIWLNRALVRAFGQEPVRKRMSGGSIPIAPFVATLGLPAVLVPAVNSDNNQHSPNENLRVGNYIEGIKMYLAILTEPMLD